MSSKFENLTFEIFTNLVQSLTNCAFGSIQFVLPQKESEPEKSHKTMQ